MQLEITRDFRLVREILTAPGVWEHAADDAKGAREAFQPNADERIVYLIAHNGGPSGRLCAQGVTGLYTAFPQTAATWELHMSRAFGGGAEKAHKAAIRWLFERTGAARIVAPVAADNRIALRAARRAGMSEWGRNPGGLLREGKLMDQVWMGISRGDL